MEQAIGRAPAFSETMPSRYRQLFHGLTAHEHAAIVDRRGSALAHAEIWRRLPQGVAIVCIVAEDRPGLLSYLGTALSTQSIDLLAAQLYGRAAPRGAEVVNLLWLRRDEAIASSVADADVSRVANLLGGLMTGELRVDGRPLAARRTSPELATLVRFDDPSDASSPATLLLETVERPGLFRAVTGALVRAGVHIVASRRASGGAGRVVHRFVIAERDGTPPDQYRRGLLQADVLRIVEPVAKDAGGVVMPNCHDRDPAAELDEADETASAVDSRADGHDRGVKPGA